MFESLINFFRKLKEVETYGSKIFWLTNIIQTVAVVWIVCIISINWKTIYASREINSWEYFLLRWLIGEIVWKSIILIFRFIKFAHTHLCLFICLKPLLNVIIIVGLALFWSSVTKPSTASSVLIEPTFAAILILDSLYLVLIFILSLRQNNTDNADNDATKEIIKNLPIHKMTEICPENVCAICYSEYAIGEQIKTLPCKHYYHSKCIDKWLHKKQTCPTCRGNVSEVVIVLE